MGRYVGTWGKVRRELGKGKKRCGGCKEMWGRCGRVGVGGVEVGGGVGRLRSGDLGLGILGLGELGSGGWGRES